MDSQVVVFRHRTAYRRVDVGKIQTLDASHLDYQDQFLCGTDRDRERRTTRRFQGVVTLSHSAFDVLWIVVPAVDDDEILEAPGHVQLAIEQEPEISGS